MILHLQKRNRNQVKRVTSLFFFISFTLSLGCTDETKTSDSEMGGQNSSSMNMMSNGGTNEDPNLQGGQENRIDEGGMSLAGSSDMTMGDPVDVPDEMIPGGVTTITGTVWMPGHGPHQTNGDTIPVLGALVYVTDEVPLPLPDQVYCDACIPVPNTAGLTDLNGRFRISNIPSGRRFLVVEKGRFRRVTPMEFRPGDEFEMPPVTTTLPSRNDPDAYQWIPRIAIATGAHDSLEDILAKMGLGEVSVSGSYITNTAQGAFDLYDNGGGAHSDEFSGTFEELVRDYDRLQQYHIVLIPCSSRLFDYSSALQDPEVLHNLRRYVAFGGRLYVTDWSGEWVDNLFPTQIQLGPEEDTPPEAYNPETDMWTPELFGNADGQEYDTPNAEVIDSNLAMWLGNQTGPNADGTRSAYDVSNFVITGNYNIIQSVNDVPLGVNAQGEPVVDSPKVWVRGGSEDEPEPKRPMTVTYEPAGCGRVLYTTYHTTDETHEGLVQQERILLYLLMEIGVCRNPKSLVSR